MKKPLSDAGRPWGLRTGWAGPEGLLFRTQQVCSSGSSLSRDLTEAYSPLTSQQGLLLPRQVGKDCTGMELCWLRSFTEQVRCTKSGGISCSKNSCSLSESPPSTLKESSSWFTVLESERESVSGNSCSSFSRYSTSSSGSLSVAMQHPDTVPVDKGSLLANQAHTSRDPTRHSHALKGITTVRLQTCSCPGQSKQTLPSSAASSASDPSMSSLPFLSA